MQSKGLQQLGDEPEEGKSVGASGLPRTRAALSQSIHREVRGAKPSSLHLWRSLPTAQNRLCYENHTGILSEQKAKKNPEMSYSSFFTNLVR